MTELEQKEKRAAAVHEIGHSFICSKFGGRAIPKIWQNTSANVQNGEKSWRGTCGISNQPSQPVLFGLAGLVAEKIDSGITDDIEIYMQIGDTVSCAPYEISQTDLKAMGTNWTEKDVKTVATLLRQNWDEIVFCADHLMTEAA